MPEQLDRHGWSSRFLVLTAMLLASAQAATAAPRKADLRYAEDQLIAMMRELRAPGAVIVIADETGPVLQRALGVRQLGKPEPMTPETIFNIASVTKQFTATAIAQLVEQKKVGFDDRMVDHLKGFVLSDATVNGSITIGDVLAHRSGVQIDYMNNMRRSRADVVRSARKGAYSGRFRIGETYSDILYTAAGEIVPSVTGLSYDDHLATHIFGPLGMTSSTSTAHDLAAASNQALGHIVDANGKLFADPVLADGWWSMDSIAPAGAINSNLIDMSKWLAANVSGRLPGVSKGVRDELLKSHNSVDPYIPGSTMAGFGYGWSVEDFRGELIAAHTGLFRGHSAAIAILPKSKLGVFIFMNVRDASESGANYILASDILAAVKDGSRTRNWPAFVAAYRADRAAQAAAAKAFADARKPDTRPHLPLAGYEGVFSHPDLGQWRVSQDTDGLKVNYLDARRPYFARLSHWHFDTFRSAWNETNPDYVPADAVTFRLAADGRVSDMVFERPSRPGARPIVFTRVDPADVPAAGIR